MPQVTVACGCRGPASPDPAGTYTKPPELLSMCCAWRSEVGSADELLALLETLRGLGPSYYVACGRPPHDVEEGAPFARRRMDRVRQGLLIFDIDGADIPEDATGAEAVALLPSWLRPHTWVHQRTPSAMTGRGYRGRLWGLLSRPVTSADLKSLARSLGPCFDLSVYSNGLVYTADPILDHDPVAAAGLARFELVRLGPELIDSALITATSAPPPSELAPSRPVGLGQAQLEAYLGRAYAGFLRDVAEARHPYRTETVKTKAVRLVGLCRGASIPLDRIRVALVSLIEAAEAGAYEGKRQAHLRRMVDWCLDAAIPPMYPPPRGWSNNTKEEP